MFLTINVLLVINLFYYPDEHEVTSVIVNVVALKRAVCAFTGQIACLLYLCIIWADYLVFLGSRTA